MARTTSYILGDELDAFIGQLVECGVYKNASEVVRAALTRMVDDEARKEQYVREALNAALANPVRHSSADTWRMVDEAVRADRETRGER